MKREVPVKKNEEYIIDIKGFGHDGEGVGKVDEFTLFTPMALKGEKVKVKVVKVNKNFGFGKLQEIIEPCENREEPICSSYFKCGGCQLQHLNYQGQLALKKDRVKDVLERIGGFTVGKDIILNDVIGMNEPYRYRNKVQLPVGADEEGIKVGFYAKKSHRIIDMDKCYIQNEEGEIITAILKKWMKAENIAPYNESTGEGIIRHIMVRKGYKTGEVMVVVVTNKKKVYGLEKLAEMLKKEIKGLVSVIQNINTKKTNVILGLENKVIWGKEDIEDYIGKFKFKISPLSFFQVNPIQTEVLYNKALEYANLTGNEVVFDAYCGTGTISLFLSQKAKKVYGVEIIDEAIIKARENAVENNVDNVEFFTGKCEEIIPEIINKGVKADVVVVDPPRKGCEESLLHAITEINPKRIVYVSCDPATLARDLKILRELGYMAEEVTPVDMFPHTSHVETVVLLQRTDN